MNKKALIVVAVLILLGIVFYFRTLVILSTVLLIAGAAFAFIKKDEAAESRKMPWQTWLLVGLSLAIYLIDWLVLGH